MQGWETGSDVGVRKGGKEQNDVQKRGGEGALCAYQALARALADESRGLGL